MARTGLRRRKTSWLRSDEVRTNHAAHTGPMRRMAAKSKAEAGVL